MWSRRDQLQAYQFMNRRIVSAVVTGDANHTEAPGRRVTLAGVTGIAVTVLLLAGLLVWGVVRPGAARSWRSGGSVIVERESGTRFVLDADGVLRPMLNYASARLFLGDAGAPTVTVSRKSLTAARRGLPLGIPDAPDSLPATNRLTAGPWVACSGPRPGAGAPATATVTLVVGAAAAPLHGTPVRDGEAVVARLAQSGDRHLVTGGRRHLLAPEAARALNLGDTSTDVLVGQAWINTVPAGPDLRLIRVAGGGAPMPGSAHAVRIGDVLRVRQLNDINMYYLALRSGLDPITQTEAQLALALPGTTLRELPVARMAALPMLADSTARRAYPRALPRIAAAPAGPAPAACATLGRQGDATLAAVSLVPAVPRGIPTTTRPVTRRGGSPVADEVLVPPGAGALVRESVGAWFEVSAGYLVTDQGIRFPLPDDAAAQALGYRGAATVAVPKPVLELLPTGPALDPAALHSAPIRTATRDDPPGGTDSVRPA